VIFHIFIGSLLELLWYKSKVKMADNLGPMAWLFLPENVLPQWQQKIAQMRKKSIQTQMVSLFGLALFSARSAIFCRY
jgi:hypothetical protein